MRIRVSIDVKKPLKRRMKLKKVGDDWILVDLNMNVSIYFSLLVVFLAILKSNAPIYMTALLAKL